MSIVNFKPKKAEFLVVDYTLKKYTISAIKRTNCFNGRTDGYSSVEVASLLKSLTEEKILGGAALLLSKL